MRYRLSDRLAWVIEDDELGSTIVDEGRGRVILDLTCEETKELMCAAETEFHFRNLWRYRAIKGGAK